MITLHIPFIGRQNIIQQFCQGVSEKNTSPAGLKYQLIQFIPYAIERSLKGDFQST
jgi:hypothetical protein